MANNQPKIPVKTNPKMPKGSRGEIKIMEILQAHDMHFEREFSFPDLNGSRAPLRFDFAVFDEEGEIDFLIEYQGIQHYQPKEDYFGGQAKFIQQKEYDKMKRRYCKEHGYILIAIPYWDDAILDYDYIMKAAGY